jgi:hypothetical protein
MDGIPPTSDARNTSRASVGIPAQLREMGGKAHQVDVEDLSVTGFRVDSIYNVRVGGRVFLTIPGFAAMEAVVAWRNKSGYGCRFERPLSTYVFDAIVARYAAR